MKHNRKITMLVILAALFCASAFALETGWYHQPDQPGHGVFIHAAPDDHYTLSWFTHGPFFEIDEDGSSSLIDPAQVWFVSENFTEQSLVPLYAPQGYVGFPVTDIGPPVGAVRVTGTEDGIKVDWRVHIWPPRCTGAIQAGPAVPFCHDTYFYRRLATE